MNDTLNRRQMERRPRAEVRSELRIKVGYNVTNEAGKRNVVSDSDDEVEAQPTKKSTPKKPPPKKQL